MAKIISLDPRHEIILEDNWVRMDEENFISFEIPGGFNWMHHAQSCSACKAFLDSFGKQTFQWCMEMDGEYFIIDLAEFGKLENHFKNLSQFQVSNKFSGTRLRFRRKHISVPLMEEDRILFEREEKYERCAELRNIIAFLDGRESY